MKANQLCYLTGTPPGRTTGDEGELGGIQVSIREGPYD